MLEVTIWKYDEFLGDNQPRVGVWSKALLGSEDGVAKGLCRVGTRCNELLVESASTVLAHGNKDTIQSNPTMTLTVESECCAVCYTGQNVYSLMRREAVVAYFLNFFEPRYDNLLSYLILPGAPEQLP